MRKTQFIITLMLVFLASASLAGKNPVVQEVEGALDTFSEGCQAELSTFCKDVTPGEGRILACLYAFGDKLSPRCEHALYDSIGQLNRTLTNLSFTINECDNDLGAYCTEIKPGEGRLLDCLKQNKTQVSPRCRHALQDVGWLD